MNKTADFLHWLARLPSLEPPSPAQAPDSPTPVEHHLWDLEHDFLREVFPDFAKDIQYLSLPFYSHTRQAGDRNRPWIERLPLFVGSQGWQAKREILGRYLLLYQGIVGRPKDKVKAELNFSFTAFAGNADEGLKEPPRFLALSLDSGSEPELAIESSSTHLLVNARLPAPDFLVPAPRISLRSFHGDSDIADAAFTPSVVGQLSADDVQDLWASWYAEVDGHFHAQAPTRQLLSGYANKCARLLPEEQKAQALEGRLRGREISPAASSEVAANFFRFLAWNYALGFKRILYLPFASADPRDSTRLVSWGGLVAVLQDSDADLNHALTDPVSSHATARTAELARTARAFVDLAIPRVLFEDWAEYTRVVQKPHQRRTARAAIMSRNLSHNVGSHSLANPRLYESVGVLNLVGSSPSSADAKIEPEGFPPTEGQIWRARERLGGLHSYLQGRMDFIARALGESTSVPQPMFFLGGLLQGFLAQTVLLNTLLSDHGFNARNLQFHVRMPESREWLTFKQPEGADKTLRHASLRPDLANFASRDVLIAVPGGMTGRHAFYALLENILRNAAKYGASAEETETLEVWLELKERTAVHASIEGEDDPTPCYQLTVWDSLSSDPDGGYARQIRSFIGEDIIRKEDGQPQLKGHGIQEMKVCAQFLAGGDGRSLGFPADAARFEAADQPYQDYLGSSGETDPPRPRELRAPLRCFDIRRDPTSEWQMGPSSHLAYSLLMLRPKLLGLLPWPPQALGTALEEPTVAIYTSIDALIAGDAQFGLICPAPDCEPSELIAQLAEHHTRLPFRLLVAASSIADQHKWESAIEHFRIAASSSWWRCPNPELKPYPLPPRRLHVALIPEATEAAKMPGGLGREAWQALTLSTYAKWLDAYKGDERRAAYAGSERIGPWHLVIGFDRSGGEHFAARWGLDGDEGDKFHGDNVAIHIYCQGGLVGPRETAEPAEGAPLQSLLVLDNHGKALPLFSDQYRGVGAYHSFGATQIALYELLENPPSDPFNRVFLVYSIVEALLTNVFIVDERVAQSTMDTREGHGAARERDLDLGGSLLTMNQARIYPLFSVGLETRGTGARTRHELSPELKQALEITGESEGLFLANQTRDPARIGAVPADFSAEGAPRPDCIVIHEGVVDVLAKRTNWQEGLTRQLHAICPWVVRTSGRGAGPRRLGAELPFLEFSELSDSSYRQMNKVNLSASLLALRGGSGAMNE